MSRFVEWAGLERAAWLSAASVAVALAVYGLLNREGYVWIAVSLVLVAAGIRVNGVVAGTNVLRGLPTNRTSIGSALVIAGLMLAAAAAALVVAGFLRARRGSA